MFLIQESGRTMEPQLQGAADAMPVAAAVLLPVDVEPVLQAARTAAPPTARALSPPMRKNPRRSNCLEMTGGGVNAFMKTPNGRVCKARQRSDLLRTLKPPARSLYP